MFEIGGFGKIIEYCAVNNIKNTNEEYIVEIPHTKNCSSLN